MCKEKFSTDMLLMQLSSRSQYSAPFCILDTNLITPKLHHVTFEPSSFSVVLCTCAAAVKAVCSEYKIHNADIHLKEDCDVDDLVDCIEGSRVYIPCIYVLNKIDQVCPKMQCKSMLFSVLCAGGRLLLCMSQCQGVTIEMQTLPVRS